MATAKMPGSLKRVLVKNGDNVRKGQLIAEVDDAVTQMDQMTQQNAALVEQSAAAAQTLAEQARELSESVSAFRLESAAA